MLAGRQHLKPFLDKALMRYVGVLVWPVLRPNQHIERHLAPLAVFGGVLAEPRRQDKALVQKGLSCLGGVYRCPPQVSGYVVVVGGTPINASNMAHVAFRGFFEEAMFTSAAAKG
jgi:hypothetical protein